MLPIEILAQNVPVHRVAGGFGLEVLGLLWPASGNTEAGIRCLAMDRLGDLFDPEAVFRSLIPIQVPRSILQSHALLAHPQGKFFSTDRLMVSDVRMSSRVWVIEFSVMHFESPDGEPAPRDLYIVLSMNPGDDQLQSLTLEFIGRSYNFQGEEIPVADRPAASLEIRFLE